MKKILNTTEFSALSPEEYKAAIRAHWGQSACGGNYPAETDRMSTEYFEQVSGYRYGSHPWLLQLLQSLEIKDRLCLELGPGMGSDHLILNRRGATAFALDLTLPHIKISCMRLGREGFAPRIARGDIEHLPYPDGAFDFVYSFGVIHHTPDIVASVREIRRVLKPGGRALLTVYNKYSLFFLWSIYCVEYLLKGGWRRRTLAQQLSRIEYPGDDENLVTRLHSKGEVKRMFADFKNVRITIRHLLPENISHFPRFLGCRQICRRLMDGLGRLLGWYLVIEAQR